MRHTITVLLHNKFGVLSRVAGLFSGRGFNIESLNVGPTIDAEVSRMTIVTSGDERIIEQINKQLNRLIDVIKVLDITRENYVNRELLLVKVNAEKEHRAELLRITEIFRGKMVDVCPKTYTIEITGSEDKVLAFIDMLRPFGIKEIARTGTVAISRGAKSLTGK